MAEYLAAKPHRRSLRLQGYDYRSAGAYFVTICTQQREPFFGAVIHAEMHLNEAGRMIQRIWESLPQWYPGIDVDSFIVMPDHIHGIILLNGGDDARQSWGIAATMSLPDVVHRFKSFSTTQYRKGVVLHQWPPFPGHVWQRNYYDHIIRHELSLQLIRTYIAENPIRWAVNHGLDEGM